MLLGKIKLDTVKFLISKALIESYISHNLIESYISHKEFLSVNNVSREYNKMKEKIKNPETSVEYTM